MCKRVLSMDLSLNCPAFCVGTIKDNKFIIETVKHVDNKNPKLTHAEKLKRTADELAAICKEYSGIDYVVREKGFSRFAATTQALFKVVGVSDLAIYDLTGIKTVEEIAPTQVKVFIGGYGKASKDEVENGLRDLLVDSQKDYPFATDDESDAVGVALTFCLKNGLLM